jgi:hypothetical protein
MYGSWCPPSATACGPPRSASARAPGRLGCWETGRSSGTPQDGRWDVPLTVPRRSLSSAWGFQACFTDRAHPSGWDCWITPEEAEYDTARGIVDQRPQVPGRPSRLQVIGLDADLNAPVLSSLTATPTTVDASHGARTVTVDVAATDVEGIREVYTRVVGEQTGLRLDPGFLGQLASGTDQDGVWRFQFDVPGGMPPDRYHVEVRILDNTHYETWSPAQDVEAGTRTHAFTPEQLLGGGIVTVG